MGEHLRKGAAVADYLRDLQIGQPETQSAPSGGNQRRKRAHPAGGKRQRVGVLTFHRCINYGSYWQARCLVEGLRARGLDAVLLEHHSREVNSAEWTCALQPVLPTTVPWQDYPRYAWKSLRFAPLFRALPRSRRFPLGQPGEMEHFHAIVVGSDEVWNLAHPWYGGCTLFYGEGLKTDRLVSYAASFGNMDADAGLDPFWVRRLERFDAISVRDANSQQLVREALGKEPPLVLDPCLQFPPALEGRARLPRKPYLAVYGHNFTPDFGAQVRAWARENGCVVVSIGYRNDFADRQWITANPRDFANFIAGAQAVATNFFHGCVFSLLNAKPFAAQVTGYRSNKLEGLMSALGAERHLLEEGSPIRQFTECLGNPLNPQIFRRLEELRRGSTAYLDEALPG